MTRRKPAKFIVRNARQVRTLTGPLPQRLIAAAERLGPCAVSELADVLGEPAESLYYHVRRLVRSGLLRECDTRGDGRHAEAVYELPGRELALDHRRRDRPYLEALGRLASAMLRLADRSYRAALRSPTTRRGGAKRTLMVQQHYARLNAPDLAELNRRLEAIATFIQERDSASARSFVSLTMVMTPVPKKGMSA